MNSSVFMRALPGAVQPNLPRPLMNFKTSVRGWLCQLYYHYPLLHYEVWNLGERRGLLALAIAHLPWRAMPGKKACELFGSRASKNGS